MTSAVLLTHKNPVIGFCQVFYNDETRQHLDIDLADKFPSDATVTLTVRIGSTEGDAIVDAQPCTYKAGSDGVYTCAVQPVIPIVAGESYFWEFKIVNASDVESHDQGEVRASYGSSSARIDLFHENPISAWCQLRYSQASLVHYDIDEEGAYPSDATVTLSIWEGGEAGTRIINEVECEYELGTDGVYSCLAEPEDSNAVIKAGKHYYWEFKVTSQQGFVVYLPGEARAKYNN